MAFVHPITVRFEDVDYARVVYFPRLLGYCHQAFEAFFPAELGLTFAQLLEERRLGFPIVHVEADFKEPFRLSQTCRVEMETLRVGGQSFTHRYRLFHGTSESQAAEARVVTALITIDTFRPTDVPDDVRAAFLRHLAADVSPGRAPAR